MGGLDVGVAAFGYAGLYLAQSNNDVLRWRLRKPPAGCHSPATALPKAVCR